MAGQARWGRGAVLLLALLLLLVLPSLLELPAKAASGLTMLLVVALLWISEALPLTITALLVPLLATLSLPAAAVAATGGGATSDGATEHWPASDLADLRHYGGVVAGVAAVKRVAGAGRDGHADRPAGAVGHRLVPAGQLAGDPAADRVGVLLLFGGGLCLSAVLQHSGASQYLAAQLGGWLTQAPSWLMLLLLCAFVVLLTELVSNTAVAARLIPLLLALATPLGLPAPLLVVLVALGASCAFMLPVATPPNAIAFASGEVSQRQMMRCGGWLYLLCILLLTAVAWLYLQGWG